MYNIQLIRLHKYIYTVAPYFSLCYSYKLWYNYLKLRRRQVKGKCITDPAFEEVNNAFERSLVFMHKVCTCT